MIDYVFIVLAYRNMEDLQELIDSIKKRVRCYKVVIVNSYYDESSKSIAEDIANKNNCDFINIENKGYSYGNNTGIEYAVNKYKFRYLVISNPDIVIKRFPKNCDDISGDIIAPCIVAKSGKHQNPMIVKRSKLAEYLIYTGFKKRKKVILFAGIGINKIMRETVLRMKKKKPIYPIYCAHGSFLLISSLAISKIGIRPYDENMFLFAEESVIALKSENAGLLTIYNSKIVVNHKEDGSMKIAGISVDSELSKANIYFYEHYCKG